MAAAVVTDTLGVSFLSERERKELRDQNEIESRESSQEILRRELRGLV